MTRTVARSGCDYIGHKPCRPQRYRPQQDGIGRNAQPKTIWATGKTKIGHTSYRPHHNHCRMTHCLLNNIIYRSFEICRPQVKLAYIGQRHAFRSTNSWNRHVPG